MVGFDCFFCPVAVPLLSYMHLLLGGTDTAPVTAPCCCVQGYSCAVVVAAAPRGTFSVPFVAAQDLWWQQSSVNHYKSWIELRWKIGRDAEHLLLWQSGSLVSVTALLASPCAGNPHSV